MAIMATSEHPPTLFCWTRFGAEAGQPINQILRRKEQERSANNGIFLWGIGNAVGAGIRELVRRCDSPEVLFSPIMGAARKEDVTPESVVAWTLAETHDGREYPLPSCSLVTSRQGVSSPKAAHYALVCFSGESLVACSQGWTLTFSTLRNLVSGRQIGASQVTAVVARDVEALEKGRTYEVAFRAHLVEPYFIRLRQPVALSPLGGSDEDWATAVESVWSQRVHQSLTSGMFSNGEALLAR
jgi:hypothetical protein